MPDSKLTKSVLSDDDANDFSHWQLPDVTESPDQSMSNMFGRIGTTPTHQSQPDKPIMPLTMAQLEEMRAAAELEGFEQGQEEGHLKGLEQGRLEGLEQGHQEGFEQGETQGFDKGMEKANELIEQLSALIEQFEKPLAILDQEVEAEILAMTLSLAKAVIGQELKLHPEHILIALRQGIDSLPIKDQLVKIRVNPSDAELINRLYTPEQLDKNQWTLDHDPALSCGDCIIESIRSTVDLTVEQRINQVFDELQEQSVQLTKSASSNKSHQESYLTSYSDDFDETQKQTQQQRKDQKLESLDAEQSENLAAEPTTLSSRSLSDEAGSAEKTELQQDKVLDDNESISAESDTDTTIDIADESTTSPENSLDEESELNEDSNRSS